MKANIIVQFESEESKKCKDFNSIMPFRALVTSYTGYSNPKTCLFKEKQRLC